MPGSATFSRDADVASLARERLDRTVALASAAERAQRGLLGGLIELWPTAAWLAAGASSAKAWLVAYTEVSHREAVRLERIAGLCARHPDLAEAVLSGTMSLRRADVLGRAVTDERARFLADCLPALLRLNRDTTDDSAFEAAIRYWAERVDEELKPQRVQPHSLTLSPRLFGGGQIHGDLAPVAFATVRTAVDAYTQNPDPTDAPYVRTLSERRADALDDLAHFALTHRHDDTGTAPDDDDEIDWDDLAATDTFDGSYPGDDLDEALADLEDADPDEVDPLVILRRRLRRAEQHRRRRARRQVRARSGVCVNVHIDLRTLSGLREVDDLDDLVLRGEGWSLTRAAADRLLCDSALVATLFDGRTKLLDANTGAEQFTRAQRRALAARDGHCVFPGCTRQPRHCDAHHLHHRHHGGPTTTRNGALLCRFHHRLIHEYGWTLGIDHDTGAWTATDPHDTTWTGRPAQPDNADQPPTGRRRRPSHQTTP